MIIRLTAVFPLRVLLKSSLRVQIPEWTAVRRAVSSGVSEMVGSLSAAGTLFLFNSAFQQSLGIDGVAALTDK